MKIVYAKTAWLAEPGVRLDASYHLSEGRQAKLSVMKSPNGTLSLASATKRVFLGARFRRVFVRDESEGFPYLTASAMIRTEPTTHTFLSKKNTNDTENLLLEKGWILLSCSGSAALGTTVLSNEDFAGKIGTHDLIRIIPNNRIVPVGYLLAFLKSKFGYALLTQGTYGSSILHIEPHHIASLPVPLLAAEEQNQIHEKVQESSRLRRESNELLTEAERLFTERLDINYEEYSRLTSPTERAIKAEFLVKAKRVTSLTLRARNYGKRLDGIIAALSKGDWKPLGELLKQEPYYTGRFRRISANGPTSIELLSQSDIFDRKPQGLHISPRTVPNLKQEITKKGMILVPGQGTLGESEIFGRAKFAWGYLEDKVVAGHVVRFIPNEELIDSGYLFTVLSSKLWFRIFRSSVYGSSLLGFIFPMLTQIPIPRFSQEVESVIGQKVKLAYDYLTKANELENTAIAHIERTIESWQV